MTLLDDHSRAVLGLLQKRPQPNPVPKPRGAALGALHRFASDLTNRPAKVRLQESPRVPCTTLAIKDMCIGCLHATFADGR